VDKAENKIKLNAR